LCIGWSACTQIDKGHGEATLLVTEGNNAVGIIRLMFPCVGGGRQKKEKERLMKL
jgi:hypothetical protein